MENPTGYTAVCEICEHIWDVTAAEADKEADWPEYYSQHCPMCGSGKVFASAAEIHTLE